MNFYFRFFGLSAASNFAIPGLISSAIERPDLHILLGCAPIFAEIYRASEELAFASSMAAPSGQPEFRLLKNRHGTVHLIYGDGVEFWLNIASGHIWSVWPESLTLDHVAPYLLGPVLGLMLRFRGVVCLHASAVVVEERAVLFTGEAGAGKSTTAAAMSQRGHALLADDIVAIVERDGEFLATPAYPYVSLWPESTEMICGQGVKLPSLTPDFEKQRFSPVTFQGSPIPVGRIFVFGERSSGESVPRTEELTPREQLMALVANSYATRVLPDALRAEEFQAFGRMVGAAPIRRLLPHSDPSLLNRLCELVEEECRQSKPRTFAD
ncbi:MAG TPA: hypothetical protein VIY69_04060 [Candidatus Acidoferrales bacterium]